MNGFLFSSLILLAVDVLPPQPSHPGVLPPQRIVGKLLVWSVKAGMTTDQVRTVFGGPDALELGVRVLPESGELEHRTTYWYWRYGVCFTGPIPHGFAAPVELPGDTVEIRTRKFRMPIGDPRHELSKIVCIRLFVSEDRGRSWKHAKDYKPTTEGVIFSAPEDGLYWFALQLVYKDGHSEPADVENLQPDMKVFVNTTGRKLTVRKSYGELLHEVEDLRTKVERLEQRIKELEAEGKPKHATATKRARD